MFFICLFKQDLDFFLSFFCFLNIFGCFQSMLYLCFQEILFSRIVNIVFFCYFVRFQFKILGLILSIVVSRLEFECVKVLLVFFIRWERIFLLVFSSIWGIFKQCCLRLEDVVKRFLRVFFKLFLFFMGRIYDFKEIWVRLIYEIDFQ